jgi:hypothetical protein
VNLVIGTPLTLINGEKYISVEGAPGGFQLYMPAEWTLDSIVELFHDMGIQLSLRMNSFEEIKRKHKMKDLEYKRPPELFPDGTPRPMGTHKLSDEQLRRLAMAVLDGKIFTSLQVREGDMRMLGSIFMPLVFMGTHSREFMFEKKGVGMLYGDMESAGNMGINGYPMLMSFSELDKEQTKEFIKYYEEAKAFKDRFISNGGSGKVDEKDPSEQKENSGQPS